MSTVYLIPSPLAEDGIQAIHRSTIDAIKNCSVFFVENDRTTRRYFKELWRTFLPGEQIVIDNYEWFVIEDGQATADAFKKQIRNNKVIGIISEAGCPGVADPGQALVAIAQQQNLKIIPLVGPNSILLALMASGMNGQQFQFLGYLPIDNKERSKAIRDLEAESARKNSTQIFIETPYRNTQMLETLLFHCKPATLLCIAVDITSKNEIVRTKTIAQWQKEKSDLHKKPAIFLIYAGEQGK